MRNTPMISKAHLDTSAILEKIKISQSKAGTQYFVWEDFIDSELYQRVEKEIQEQSYNKVDTHSSHHRNNKTVLLKGEALHKLHNFFESRVLEKFLSLFVGQDIKQEFYIDQKEIQSLVWDDAFRGAVAQIYEKWDFFDWHIDGPTSQGSLWAFTYYLWWYTGEWNENFGWNLELWKRGVNGEIACESVVPYKKNTLVLIIASSEAYHRVTKLEKDILRLSIQSTIMKK